jgi:hypothetical protein
MELRINPGQKLMARIRDYRRVLVMTEAASPAYCKLLPDWPPQTEEVPWNTVWQNSNIRVYLPHYLSQGIRANCNQVSYSSSTLNRILHIRTPVKIVPLCKYIIIDFVNQPVPCMQMPPRSERPMLSKALPSNKAVTRYIRAPGSLVVSNPPVFPQFLERKYNTLVTSSTWAAVPYIIMNTPDGGRYRHDAAFIPQPSVVL